MASFYFIKQKETQENELTVAKGKEYGSGVWD